MVKARQNHTGAAAPADDQGAGPSRRTNVRQENLAGSIKADKQVRRAAQRGSLPAPQAALAPLPSLVLPS